MTTPNIPTGYRQDAKGRLIPEDQIKEIDLERDALVTDLFARAEEINSVLRAFRIRCHDDIQAFVELSAEKYGAHLGGRKGNLTLASYDGRIRILRAMADQLVFDERLQAAKALIDECVKEWSTTSRPEIITLVTDAFQVDKAGKIDTARILSLRKLKIDDHRWLKAMEAISDSLQVDSVKSYLRFYERPGEDENYRQINLDLANA